jgi:hypothetical protein
MPTRTFEIQLPGMPSKGHKSPIALSYTEAVESAVALARYHGAAKVVLYWGDDRTDLEIPASLLSK